MKKTKKSLAMILCMMMLLTVCALPAKAASVGNVSYTAPAGYAEEMTLVTTDFASYAYLTGNKTGDGKTIYDSLNVNRGTAFDKYIASQGSLTSVRGVTLDTWKAWFAKFQVDVDPTAKASDIKFISYGQNEYLLCDFTKVSENVTVRFICYIYIDGAGQSYSIYYAVTDKGLPQLQAFYNMLGSAAFTYPAKAGTAASDTIKIYVNGSQVFPDADPFIMNNRTMVPIRVIAEALGYRVDWDGASRCITMTKGDFAVQVMIDSTWITKYKGSKAPEYAFFSDAVPTIQNNRTFLPVRAVTEAMGCAVDWDGNTRSVYITN